MRLWAFGRVWKQLLIGTNPCRSSNISFVIIFTSITCRVVFGWITNSKSKMWPSFITFSTILYPYFFWCDNSSTHACSRPTCLRWLNDEWMITACSNHSYLVVKLKCKHCSLISDWVKNVSFHMCGVYWARGGLDLPHIRTMNSMLAQNYLQLFVYISSVCTLSFFMVGLHF